MPPEKFELLEVQKPYSLLAVQAKLKEIGSYSLAAFIAVYYNKIVIDWQKMTFVRI